MRHIPPVFEHSSLGSREKAIDSYHLFVQLVPHMVVLARSKATKEKESFGNASWYSYRKFPVLCTGLCVDSVSQRSAIFATGNLKRENKYKVCAEQRMVGQAKTQHYTDLVGLVIASTVNPQEIKDVLEYDRETLIPCFDCAFHALDNPLVSADLPIVSTGLEKDLYQVVTLAEARSFHEGRELPPFSQTTNSSFAGWEHRVALYDHWAEQREQSPDGQPSNAVLARAAIGMHASRILDGFSIPSHGVPETFGLAA